MRCQASHTALFCKGFQNTADAKCTLENEARKGPAGVKTAGQKQPLALWEKFDMIYDFLADESSVCCAPHVDDSE